MESGAIREAATCSFWSLASQSFQSSRRDKLCYNKVSKWLPLAFKIKPIFSTWSFGIVLRPQPLLTLLRCVLFPSSGMCLLPPFAWINPNHLWSQLRGNLLREDDPNTENQIRHLCKSSSVDTIHNMLACVSIQTCGLHLFYLIVSFMKRKQSVLLILAPWPSFLDHYRHLVNRV